jgi:TetR/AcrR family transcriptional regulator, regulator of cefoperazone and chloramphenicol sensitivity
MTDATKQRLIESAEEVFADKGFEAASVREICARADANVAAVNYYFDNKDELYKEAVKYAYRGCTEGAPFPEWGTETPPAEKLRDFIRVMVTRMLSPQSAASLHLMMREMAHPTKACEEVVRDYIRPIAEKLGGILAELLPNATEQQRYLVAFSIVGQCHFYRSNRAVASLLIGERQFQQFDDVRVADHIASFTLRALGLEEQKSRRPSTARPEGVEP